MFQLSNGTVGPAALRASPAPSRAGIGVRIFEQTKITGIRPSGTVKLSRRERDHPSAECRDRDQRWPASTTLNKLFVISSDMIATEPIAGRLDEIGWNWGESISDPQTSSAITTTAEGRIAFGKGVGPRLRRRSLRDAPRLYSCLDGDAGLPSLLPDAAYGQDHP